MTKIFPSFWVDGRLSPENFQSFPVLLATMSINGLVNGRNFISIVEVVLLRVFFRKGKYVNSDIIISLAWLLCHSLWFQISWHDLINKNMHLLNTNKETYLGSWGLRFCDSTLILPWFSSCTCMIPFPYLCYSMVHLLFLFYELPFLCYWDINFIKKYEILSLKSQVEFNISSRLNQGLDKCLDHINIS